MAESEEALQLKRRARRRLVGAIALVTFVVIVLPLILDKEPGPAGPPLSVQIPAPEAVGFNSRVEPPAPAVPAAPVPENKAEIAPAKVEPPSPKAASPALQSVPSMPGAASPAAQLAPSTPKAEAAAGAAANAAKTEAQRARAALRDQAWVVALDAFSDKKNVRQLRTRLSAAGVKSYTESVNTGRGALTRVRAGPFASKEAAEKARAKMAAMGLKPGAVTSR